MTKLSSSFKSQNQDETSIKILISLQNQVYKQSNVGIFSSFFCALIILIGLYLPKNIHTDLIAEWVIFFVTINLIRLVFLNIYNPQDFHYKDIYMWRNLYIVGAFLGGLSWGSLAVYLFPVANDAQQTLIILMIAGVTAGVVPLSAANPFAAVSFLITSIVPFIYRFAVMNNIELILFDLSLTLYLIYTITIVIMSYQLMKNSITLKFENDELVLNLSEAKSQLELSNKKLEQAATHDALTQVANRNLFQDNLELAIKNAEKNKKMLALFYIDVDKFKTINDTYGHYAGDYVLVLMTQRLKKYFNGDKNIARLGGDELTIIIEEIDSIKMIRKIANEVCHLLAFPMRLDNSNIIITVSIGISVYPDDGEDADTLLHFADKTMYEVKKMGGNNYKLTTKEEVLLETENK